MKTAIYFILFFLSVFYANAQNSIVPNSNKYTLYIDNILVGNEEDTDYSKIPAVLFENYYKEFADTVASKKMIKEFFLEKDTVCLKNRLHIRTKQAKDGYLLINKTLSDKITECCNGWNEIVISYVYNGKIVSTKKEVKQIFKLRAKKIQILSVEQDASTKVITINFSDK
ncbi:MAG: hypothetical protein LBS50_10315 [Prevotellaceae bacterium]|jgi:uncharacterized protein involved in tolerance to divalent cations|nr:hypothetical protein [Prevotellaceae bacterium]